MKIGVLAYNFEHKKTFEGLVKLFLHGVEVTCVIAADPVSIRFAQSRIRVVPKGLRFPHPRAVSERLAIPYHVLAHNSQEAADLVRTRDLDLGIILGARIIKPPTIGAFKLGILNLHPGLLPENRGLDNVKWAVLKGLKQGATVHFIDERIDAGSPVVRRTVEVFPDDTLVDLTLRLQNLELELMVEALELVASRGRGAFPPLDGQGATFKAVPPDLEASLPARFEEYKAEYSRLSDPPALTRAGAS